MSGYDGCTFCRKQALLVEERDERIRQLEAELFNRDWWPPGELRLTSMETSIVQAMVRSEGRPLTKEFLVDATRSPASHKSDPEPKIIDTVICKLRGKLRPRGLYVETVYGRGYRLTPDSRARLLNWNTDTQAAAAGA